MMWPHWDKLVFYEDAVDLRYYNNFIFSEDKKCRLFSSFLHTKVSVNCFQHRDFYNVLIFP